MTNLLNLDNEIRIGDIVGSTNRIVIAYTKKSERVPGDCYAVWVTICHKEGEHHPFVVWDVIARPEGFAAEHGDYCFTLQEAITAYKKRGGEA
jgi:hypothetical protein